MKYAFIERHRRIWPICVQCRVLGVSVSGFHQHRTRRRKIATRRHLTDAALLAHISAVYAEHRGAYGWPRIWRELVKRGIRVGSAKDGSVKYFIPDPIDKSDTTSAAEGVAVDKDGIVYGAEVGSRRLMRYVMKTP